MRVITLTLLQLVALAALAAAAEPGRWERPQEAPLRAVIVTGVDWPGRPPMVPGHVWKETAPALKEVLEADKRFRVTIVEDPGFLASDELLKFDAVVLHFKNYDPIPQEEQAKANLTKFIQDGRGLVVVHYASGAFENWSAFRDLVGRTQGKRHDKRGPFTVKIVNRDHPVTKGMDDFQTDDELFIDLTGDRPIEVLAVAQSTITGEDHPMAFTLKYGKGRVFHTTLGHDTRAIRMPGTAELIRRGAAWAAAPAAAAASPLPEGPPLAKAPVIRSFCTGGHTIHHAKAATIRKDTGRTMIAASMSGKVLCFTMNGEKVWEQDTGGFFPFDLDVGDLDGDGLDEACIASADGALYALDHNGKLRSLHLIRRSE